MEDSMFTVVKHAAGGPRLGRLLRPGRTAIETPGYIASISRGTIPHLTPDTLTRSTLVNGIYVSIEDFIERAPTSTPPVCQMPSASQGRLRRFMALPQQPLLVLGVRRCPPVIAPPATSNTSTTVAVCTSVGFQYLGAEAYARWSEELEVDIVVSLADVPFGRALGSKRIESATDRSIEWLQYHIDQRKSGDRSALFASLLPVPVRNQQYYVDVVEENVARIDGLAIHSLDTIRELPECLGHLPRLGLIDVQTPMQILENIKTGVDVLVVPFIDSATDAGMAFDFQFKHIAVSAETPLPLAVDMWSTEHAQQVAPLTADCTCYACITHHRAYIHHLLDAKEMLGWVLLQIHNHHCINRFFEQIRQSILDGRFEEDVEAFARTYEPGFPQKTGQGPRVRGYQRKSEGRGEPKINRAAFIKYQASLAGKQAAAQKQTPTNTSSADVLAGDFDLNLLEASDEIAATEEVPTFTSEGR